MRGQRRWEIVHTVNEFYDVPRLGVADFDGTPHVYACVFDPVVDDWTSTYQLSPINEAGFTAVKEAWDIWSRWQSSFYAQTLKDDDHHPALAVDRARYEELRPIVARHLKADRGFVAKANFRGSMHPQMLEVFWFEH